MLCGKGVEEEGRIAGAELLVSSLHRAFLSFFLFTFIYLKNLKNKVYLSNCYTQRGDRTHHLEIKSPMLCPQSQPGTLAHSISALIPNLPTLLPENKALKPSGPSPWKNLVTTSVTPADPWVPRNLLMRISLPSAHTTSSRQITRPDAVVYGTLQELVHG